VKAQVWPWLGAALALALGAAAETPQAQWQVAFPQLKFARPLFLCPLPGNADKLVVVEQRGKVYSFPNSPEAQQAETILDIQPKVLRRGNEEGLLGLAFHPDFKQNGSFYVMYSAPNPRRNVLSRFRLDPASGKAAPNSEAVILEVPQPYSNHNGGMLAFGPDGYLYIALGDGGSGGDPRGNGQNRATLLGAILRIDVDKTTPGRAYAIPADNPFVGKPDARGEIWAYGLRNPWRFSFDPDTGRLWAGDVGQVKWEEIDVIVKGGNYGWNVREGKHPYRPRAGLSTPLLDPVVEHGRADAKSITGGYVYRGKRLPALTGAYIYGDFVTGKVWYLRYDPASEKVTEHGRLGRVPTIASFGIDSAGELYITSFTGRIHALFPRP